MVLVLVVLGVIGRILADGMSNVADTRCRVSLHAPRVVPFGGRSTL